MVLCLSMASLVLTYLYSTDTFIFVFMVFVSLFLHRQYPHQMTVSKASLVRNLPSASASGRVSASARADQEGFFPPSRDWTTSPSTPASPLSTASAPPTPSLPAPTEVRDSSNRLAIGFPKLRRKEEDTA